MTKDKATAMTPQMDWRQVVLNGGPPCFYVEGPQFCGRAERWPGHGNPAFHDFVSLDSILNERDQLLAEVGRLKSALKRIEKQWHKGVSKHEVIPDCSGCVACAALSTDKEPANNEVRP